MIDQAIKRKPYLALYKKENSVSDFSVENSVSGYSILCQNLPDGKKKYLASRYDPITEARRGLPPAISKWDGTEIVLILGGGNPFLPLELSRALRDNQICITIDAFFETGILLCSDTPEFSEYLLRPGSHLFCGREMLETLRAYLDSIPGERLGGIRIVRHRASVQLDPEFYEEAESYVRQAVRAKMSDMLTRFEFERKWIANIITNSIYFERSGPEGNPAGIARYSKPLRGVPAMIIAAGPSLRRSLPVIKNLENKCFLLACDTAYKALLRGGITPHAVITLDAQKHTLLHFLGTEGMENTVLFADIVASPFVLRKIRPERVIFSTTAKWSTSADGNLHREATAGSEYLEKIAGPIGDIQSGGSVATSAFDLLRNFGASAIYLIGQDLAYTGREIHSTGSHHNERWLTTITRKKSLEFINEAVIRRRETYAVEALSGGEILTDYVLDLYRHWFEDAALKTEMPVRNLTLEGARIQNIEAQKAEELLDLPAIPGLSGIFQGQALALHRHPENATLYRELRQTMRVLGSDASMEQKIKKRAEFLEQFPFLNTLFRQTEVYIRRNKEKLTDERIASLQSSSALTNLKALERSLRPYFQGE